MNVSIRSPQVTEVAMRMQAASGRMRASTHEFAVLCGKLLAYSVQEKEPIGLTRQLHDGTEAHDYGNVQRINAEDIDYVGFIETGERNDPRVHNNPVRRGGAHVSMEARRYSGRVRKSRLGRFITQSGGVFMFRRTMDEYRDVLGPAVRQFQADMVRAILGR